MEYPETPDGRYFVVRGRLWRKTSPLLDEAVRVELVAKLMVARRSVGVAKRAGDVDAVAHARQAVDKAKRALGERGPVWWTDGAPDLNQHMVAKTMYSDWFAALSADNATTT